MLLPQVMRPPCGPTVRDLRIRKDHLELVRHCMEKVTDFPIGTARYLQLGGQCRDIDVAVQTGTTERGNPVLSDRFPNQASLIGYAPADNPPSSSTAGAAAAKRGSRAEYRALRSAG